MYETNFPGFPFNTNYYIINYTLLFALTASSTPPPKLELPLRPLLKPPSNSSFSLSKNVVRCSAKNCHVGHLHRRCCPSYQPEISSASTNRLLKTLFKKDKNSRKYLNVHTDIFPLSTNNRPCVIRVVIVKTKNKKEQRLASHQRSRKSPQLKQRRNTRSTNVS